MILEAAYSLYERGGFVHGHDLDDWLAAEAYIDSILSSHQNKTDRLNPRNRRCGKAADAALPAARR